MKQKTSLSALGLIFLIASCTIPEKPGGSSLIPSAMHKQVAVSPLIFSGTIKLLRTSTIDVDEVKDLMVVQVDDLLKATGDYNHLQGKLITVQADNIGSFRLDQSRIFITDSWMFGEGIAVRLIGDFAVENFDNQQKEVVQQIDEINEKQMLEILTRQVETAEVIFAGNVVDIKNIKIKTEKESEHDPKWSLAVIQVSEILKGLKPEQKEISVMYASSMDVMWFSSPKFEEKDQGVWVLTQTSKKAMIATGDSDYYIVTGKNEYVTDKKTIDQIRTILK